MYPGIAHDYWRLWRGNLSVTHAHLYSYLKSDSNENNLLVTGFMADPIAGYAASQRQEPVMPLESSAVFKKLKFHGDELGIVAPVVSDIGEDLAALYGEWKDNNHTVGFDEYVYLTQRQSKIFCLLVHTYRDFCEVTAPYADPMLARLFLSAPYELRKNKKIMRLMMNLRNPELAHIDDLSSSLSDHSFKHVIRSVQRKWSSRLSVVLNLVTQDTIRYFSPFWTEDLNGAFRCECRHGIVSTVKHLYDSGLISYEQFNLMTKKPVRSYEVYRCGKVLSFLPVVS
jgi:hypothetical protein